MELDGAQVLVCGAGAIGAALAHELHGAGSRVVVAGRDADALGELAAELGTEALAFDVVDVTSCGQVVADAVSQLDGGLDALVVTVGVAGFGRAVELDDAVAEELFAVNALGPMALVRAASPHLEGGVAVVLSAVLADLPTAQMADYSAAKSALSTWLGVVRREERRRLRVIDVRPPHLDTGLEQRALAGDPPRLPSPQPAADVVRLVVQAMREDAKEIAVDTGSGELTIR